MWFFSRTLLLWLECVPQRFMCYQVLFLDSQVQGRAVGIMIREFRRDSPVCVLTKHAKPKLSKSCPGTGLLPPRNVVWVSWNSFGVIGGVGGCLPSMWVQSPVLPKTKQDRTKWKALLSASLFLLERNIWLHVAKLYRSGKSVMASVLVKSLFFIYFFASSAQIRIT